VNKLGIEHCIADFTAANFRCEEEFLRRFVASLTAKRFVILTGMSGSGKTKLVQAFARWISSPQFATDPFERGTQVGNSYRVMDSDRISVEFWNKKNEKVVLPRLLINEWADFLEEFPELQDLPSVEIREKFNNQYELREGDKFARHAILWDTHLKPAAIAVIESKKLITTPGRRYELVSVGADWTSNEQVLGYPDGLDRTRYVRTKALDLILSAIKSPNLPHFLILDEMNLSHVERYFADLLSAIESDEPLHLHGEKMPDGTPGIRDGIPGEITLPPNLFIIGTVNVDETTYMFSPKVLDRANVLEFRVSETDLSGFLATPLAIDFQKIDGKGVKHGLNFMALSKSLPSLAPEEQESFASEIMLFFRALRSAGSEFGFRLAKEATSFVANHKQLTGNTWDFRAAMDAQILQKILPKLHGSRNKLEPVLCSLAQLCFSPRSSNYQSSEERASEAGSLLAAAMKAAAMEDDSLDPLGIAADGNPSYPKSKAHYPQSFDKIIRMLESVRMNGFASFAEG
jgi:tRNA A37 threonylcarbamoyladenosine biosynthesis protein TsaE